MVSRGRYQFVDVEGQVILLVEGTDDARFFDAFLRHLNISQVQIVSVNGADNFAPFLKNTLITAPGYPKLRQLALARDADDNARAAFQSIGSALAGAGLPVPAAPFQTSAMGQLSVSVAILPDGETPGNLEDLCLRSVNDRLALECVEQYLACRNMGSVPGGRLSEARLHSYLAVSDEPGLRLGEAADAGVWDWGSPALQPLGVFLSQL